MEAKKVVSLSSVNVCNNCGKYNENYYIWTVVFSRPMPRWYRCAIAMQNYWIQVLHLWQKHIRRKKDKQYSTHTHTVILLPWLAQIEQITYSRSKNQLRFFLLGASMFVSRAALSVGDICKWIYASYQAGFFCLLSCGFSILFYFLFFSGIQQLCWDFSNHWHSCPALALYADKMVT